MISFVHGEDKAVAKWVAARIPNLKAESLATPDANGTLRWVAIGVQNEHKPLVGAVFHNFRTHDIEITFAAEPGGLASRRIIRGILAYPFVQLGCVRLTAIIAKKNRDARHFVKRIGFHQEGCCWKAFDGKEDAIIYGLRVTEARKRWFPNDTRQERQVRSSNSSPAGTVSSGAPDVLDTGPALVSVHL